MKTDDIANWIICLETMRYFKKENRDAENEIFLQIIKYHNRVTQKMYDQVHTFIKENFEHHEEYSSIYPSCATMTDYYSTKARRKGYSYGAGIMISDVSRTGAITLNTSNEDNT